VSTSPLALKIVNPIAITDAMLIDSGSPPETNVPENDYAVWDSGTTYALGDRVILVSTHKIYESLQGANLNKNPVTQTTWWVEVGPTNRWAVFDNSISTQTEQSTNITYTLEPNTPINTIAVLNVTNATELQIEMTSPTAGIVYDETISFAPLPVTPDWWAWFYGQRIQNKQHIALDIPIYTDAEIRITLLGGANLAVGAILLGQQQNFGLGISYGARVGIQDYSRKETNEFGDTILVQRAFAKRANFSLLLGKSEVDSFQNFLADIRATPVLWIGSTEYDSTTLFGFYKNFDILISYPEQSDCELEIEGLT
jgi:hypothetical protein